MPCAGADLIQFIQINLIDDFDLELSHEFSINFLDVDPTGVMMEGPLPLTQTIIDNGQ